MDTRETFKALISQPEAHNRFKINRNTLYSLRLRFNKGTITIDCIEKYLQKAGFQKIIQEHWAVLEVPTQKKKRKAKSLFKF
jgi:hypothetical protein